MGDRYSGLIKCPYCDKDTEYLFNDEWGQVQWCEWCGKRFIIEMDLIAKEYSQSTGHTKDLELFEKVGQAVIKEDEKLLEELGRN